MSLHIPAIFGCVMILMMSGVSLGIEGRDAEEILFEDRFAGKLAEGWRWVREDPKGWRVSEKGLEVHVQPGNMWGGANNAKNVLVRPLPVDPGKQPVEVSATLFNRPTHQYEQVDLVWYYADSHMVKIGQELVDGKLSIVMGREENDRTRTIAIIPIAADTVQVRFLVSGKQLRGQYKVAEGEWKEAGACDVPAKGEPQISLQFYQGPADQAHWARVSEFTIRKWDGK